MQSLKTFLRKGLCISCAARTLQRTHKRKAHASHLELLHTHIYHKCKDHHAICKTPLSNGVHAI